MLVPSSSTTNLAVPSLPQSTSIRSLLSSPSPEVNRGTTQESESQEGSSATSAAIDLTTTQPSSTKRSRSSTFEQGASSRVRTSRTASSATNVILFDDDDDVIVSSSTNTTTIPSTTTATSNRRRTQQQQPNNSASIATTTTTTARNRKRPRRQDVVDLTLDSPVARTPAPILVSDTPPASNYNTSNRSRPEPSLNPVTLDALTRLFFAGALSSPPTPPRQSHPAPILQPPPQFTPVPEPDDPARLTCVVCMCTPDSKTPLSATICGHIFCESCLKASMKHQKKCPTCRKSLAGKNAFHRLFL